MILERHFSMWQSYGKPRFNPVCKLMTKHRARFKYSLHYRKSIEDKAKVDIIAKKVLLKGIICWKDVNKLSKVSSDILTSTVDGVTGVDKICEIWHDHYSKLLNSNSDTTM